MALYYKVYDQGKLVAACRFLTDVEALMSRRNRVAKLRGRVFWNAGKRGIPTFDDLLVASLALTEKISEERNLREDRA